VGDQQIPEVVEEEIKLQDTPSAEATVSEEEVSAPLGLERHYPVEEPSTRVAEATESQPVAESAATEASSAEGLSVDELGVPSGASAAEGLTSSRPDVKSALDTWESPPDTPRQAGYTPRAAAPALDVEPPQGEAEAPASHAEAAAAHAEVAPAQADTMSAHADAAPAQTEAPAREQAAAKSPNPPRPDFTERVEPPQRGETASPAEEKTFSGASAEPFVNETMAQLYLKQGYKQLALKVYRQLVFARPNDEALRKRIAEIEAEDAAEHPGEVPVARTREPVEETPRQSEPARPPSVESPAPARSPESEEAPAFEPSFADSPPAREPTRRESVEAPPREGPAREARQPSIREFFATLGRRRPPRTGSTGGSRSGNNQPAESAEPFGASPPAATLDSVFAGASVSPADARAASRLAGAFSGASGTSRTTPPTPPMPTPRVNARVQAQESEEDVAKFRAWLDGLTGE
ncbi:MAG TPA: hypothetical protein VE110_08595, partial [Gemmatimonadaceae bacterium]|nr:hypothetical protein [Gemmatimonadaceae bacterium]